MAFFISMPVKVEKRGEEYCVVEPDGAEVKCHSKKSEAVKHAAAININTSKSRLTIFKDHAGVWNWFGVVSNNREDREEDILTSDSHRKFVENIDTGFYRETFGKDAPDLWVWHIPVPVGYAEMVAYDERGFLLGAGKGHQGEFYDKVFEGLAKAEEKEPGVIGMSHGMPWEYLEMEKADPHLVTGYMSEEFTFLPLEHAANFGTGIGGIMVKSMPLEIEDYKREWFVDTFGDDVVSQFDTRLSEIGKAADEAEIPKKEITMTDSTKKKKDEKTVADEVDEETVVEDELATDLELEEVEDKQEDDDEEEEEEEEKKQEEDDEEEEEEEDEDKQYATLSDLEEVVKEVVKGVTEPFAEVITNIAELREDLNEMRKELDTLKQTEDIRVTEKVKETPAASLSAIIARTIEGQKGAQIDYDKERKLHQAGPEEAEHVMSPSAGMTGIAHIDALITKQRGRNRVVTARTNGQ